MRMLSLAAVLALPAAANAEYLRWGVEVTGVSADEEWGHMPAVASIDESGLSGDLHDDDSLNMWGSRTAGTTHWIRWTFDGAYPLGKVWVWNRNDTSPTYGSRSVDVYYTPAGGGADVLLGNYEFAIAPGTPDYAHNTEIDFGGVEAEGVFSAAHRLGCRVGQWQPKRGTLQSPGRAEQLRSRRLEQRWCYRRP